MSTLYKIAIDLGIVIGYGFILYGLEMIYPPLMWIAAGATSIGYSFLIGQALHRKDDRNDSR